MLNQVHDIELIDSSEQKVKARQCSLTCVSEAIPEQRKTHSKEPSQQMENWHSKWKWHESTIIVREYLNYVVYAQFYGKDTDLFFTRELSCTTNKNAGFPMKNSLGNKWNHSFVKLKTEQNFKQKVPQNPGGNTNLYAFKHNHIRMAD